MVATEKTPTNRHHWSQLSIGTSSDQAWPQLRLSGDHSVVLLALSCFPLFQAYMKQFGCVVCACIEGDSCTFLFLADTSHVQDTGSALQIPVAQNASSYLHTKLASGFLSWMKKNMQVCHFNLFASVVQTVARTVIKGDLSVAIAL